MNQFLKTVNYPLLTQPHNLRHVVEYLDSKPVLATRGITLDTFNRLCSALCARQLWSPLISLCHRCLHLVSTTRTIICKPLEAIVRNLGVTEKVLSVFERLTEDQKAFLNTEVSFGGAVLNNAHCSIVFPVQVWNKVVLACCQKGRTQRASKFYATATKVAKQLSSEVREGKKAVLSR